MLGNGDGTFGSEIVAMQDFDIYQLTEMLTADVNNDNELDLIVTQLSVGYVIVMLGGVMELFKCVR